MCVIFGLTINVNAANQVRDSNGNTWNLYMVVEAQYGNSGGGLIGRSQRLYVYTKNINSTNTIIKVIKPEDIHNGYASNLKTAQKNNTGNGYEYKIDDKGWFLYFSF